MPRLLKNDCRISLKSTHLKFKGYITEELAAKIIAIIAADAGTTYLKKFKIPDTNLKDNGTGNG